MASGALATMTPEEERAWAGEQQWGPLLQRMKPQHPHAHRIRLGSPQGLIVKGKCRDCGRFRVQWYDGPPEKVWGNKKGADVIEFAMERGRAAWEEGEKEPEKEPLPVETKARRPGPKAVKSMEMLRILREAKGEFVPTTSLALVLYGKADHEDGVKVGALALNLRNRYGRENLISQQGKGYAWRGGE